ncbi:MAG TPA: hypothetical protein VMW83_02975 [Spirochaetia bacterium]|nr:hypothetical protein [Spirochaetia bacterium]
MRGQAGLHLEDGPVDPESGPACDARQLGIQLVAVITLKKEFPEQLREI